MRSPGQPDCFQVVNGPEDGVEFPLVRSPFEIGQDPRCAVSISLDNSVQEKHALVASVSDGYRVRRLTREPVLVDDRSTGMYRSRVVRDGGYIQVGRTLMVLECAPDGLACRSRGVVSQSDSGWALQHVGRFVLRRVRGILSLVAWAVARLLTSWLGVLSILVLLYLFWDGFRFQVNRLVSLAYRFLADRILGALF